MRSMRKYLNKLIEKKIFRSLRVLINYKPKPIEIYKINKSQSISDAFIWRTDNNFETIFRFTNILKFFYKTESSFYLSFYDRRHTNIKNMKIDNLNNKNELKINKALLNGIEDYGTFYIFHKPNKPFKTQNNIILSNRCYVGFSKNNCIPSFVHGNTLVKSMDFNSNKTESDYVKISPFYNQNYFIQNDFSFFDRTEICICNPTSKKIIFYVNKIKYELNGWNSIIINLERNQKLINIKSKCMFLRPIIFNFKDKYFDVYHA